MRRGLVLFPLGMVAYAALSGLFLFAWWHAQVTHVPDVGQKGYVEGDPFPWFFLVFGVVTVGVCFAFWIRCWVQWWRLRRTAT